MINVTSQKWLETTKAAGPGGDLWTHQVLVVVPKELKHSTIALSYLTGNCNNHPSVPDKYDEELLMIDTISHNNGVVAIIVYQLPNCPIVYPSDPEHRGRGEDAMIAWVRDACVLRACCVTQLVERSSRLTLLSQHFHFLLLILMMWVRSDVNSNPISNVPLPSEKHASPAAAAAAGWTAGNENAKLLAPESEEEAAALLLLLPEAPTAGFGGATARSASKLERKQVLSSSLKSDPKSLARGRSVVMSAFTFGSAASTIADEAGNTAAPANVGSVITARRQRRDRAPKSCETPQRAAADSAAAVFGGFDFPASVEGGITAAQAPPAPPAGGMRGAQRAASTAGGMFGAMQESP